MDSAPWIPTENSLDNLASYNESIATTDPMTYALDVSQNARVVVEWIPRLQRDYRLAAPNPQFDLGWREGFVNTNVTGIPAYETQAPDPNYSPLNYSNLIAQSANPPPVVSSNPGGALRAPMINEGM